MLGHATLHRIAPSLFTSTQGLPLSIPGPEPTRLLGVGGALFPWAADSLGHASLLFRRYGRVVALVRGGGMRHISPDSGCPGTVLCYGPDCVEQATTHHELFTKTSLVGALHPGHEASPRETPLLSFGSGLFAVNGDQHRRHRRLLTPAFSKRRLASYAQQMVSETLLLLDQYENGQIRNLSHDMRELTSRIVTRTLLGGTNGQETQRAASHLTQALGLLGNPVTRLLAYDWPGFPYRRYLDHARDLERGMLKLLEARKSAEEGSDQADMLSALLGAYDEESRTRLNDLEILGHISVFFSAGHETSANALTWTLLLLALFPEVAERAVDEVAHTLQGDFPTAENVERLTYLGAVIKESMRLFPPAPWNGRLLAQATQILGHEVPQGAEVLVSIYETHRMPEIFVDPLRFSPDRWALKKPSSFEYCPFSAGPRTCIGAAFATLEMKIVLALILGRKRLALVPQKVDRFAELVLSPRYGVRMKVEPADGQFMRSRARISGNIRDMVELPLD